MARGDVASRVAHGFHGEAAKGMGVVTVDEGNENV